MPTVPPSPTQSSGSPAAAVAPLVNRPGVTRRVLVVEDDANVARETCAALVDHGFEVELVTTGHEALSRARRDGLDAIVLDRMLPDIDGLSVLSTLRNIGRTTPVLILSALTAVDERIRGLRVGGDDYLTKPFDTLELTARLHALLRCKTLDASPTQLRCEDLLVDTALHQAYRNNETLDLKRREYQLLVYLMQHMGQVVTRAMLFEAVWSYPFNAQSNVIDMHISNLRRKVSLNGKASPLIRTVRSVGYTLHESEG